MADDNRDQRALEATERGSQRGVRGRFRQIAGQLKDGIKKNWRGLARHVGEAGVRGAFTAASRIGQGDPSLDPRASEYRDFIDALLALHTVLDLISIANDTETSFNTVQAFAGALATWTRRSVDAARRAIPKQNKEDWSNTTMKALALNEDIQEAVKAMHASKLPSSSSMLREVLQKSSSLESELLKIGKGFEVDLPDRVKALSFDRNAPLRVGR